MKLITLTLRNFKGIRQFGLSPVGSNVEILGDNGTGKTSVADAFAWLLTGKDSSSKSDFEIQPLDKAGPPVHNLETSVEAVLELDDGRQAKLKRVYAEEWTKKRGSATATLSGHPTTFFIDDVPKPLKLFDEFISRIADAQLFRLLTNPNYFNETLKWQDRRKLLLEIAGNVLDEEVIASDEKLKPLLAVITAGRTLEDHKAVLAAKRSKINEHLKMIPVRIDEVNRGLPELKETDGAAIEADIQRAEAELETARGLVVRIESGIVGSATNELSDANIRIKEIENKIYLAKIQKIQDAEQREREFSGVVRQLDQDLNFVNSTHERLLRQRDKIEDRLTDKRNEWKTEKARTFGGIPQTTVCPACGQDIPKEQLEEALQAATEDFNLKKAARLREIDQDGATLKAEKKGHEDEMLALSEKAADLAQKLILQREMVDAVREEIRKAQTPETFTPKELIDAQNSRDVILAKIEGLKDNSLAGLTDAKEAVAIKEIVLRGLKNSLARLDQAKAGLKRIEELAEEQKRIGAEFEQLEKELFLADEFTKAKVAILESKINAKFKYARFKLFDVQMNEGVKDCCETTYKGVPFGGGLNYGARINVGLDIINTLSEHFKITMPIFIDNAEAVTDIFQTKAQTIKLIKPEITTSFAYEKFSKLVVEIESADKQQILGGMK